MISGIVRPYDIDGANQIQSTKVANLQVDFRGTGSASAKATPGILSRLFNWLF
ncbi:flagellar basal body L-ring protein [compost metagenome]